MHPLNGYPTNRKVPLCVLAIHGLLVTLRDVSAHPDEEIVLAQVSVLVEFHAIVTVSMTSTVRSVLPFAVIVAVGTGGVTVIFTKGVLHPLQTLEELHALAKAVCVEPATHPILSGVPPVPLLVSVL